MNSKNLHILIDCIWQQLESKNYLTESELKVNLKDLILKDEDYKMITKKINDAPETFKKNQNYLEIFLKEDEEIKEILLHAKLNVTNQVNFENNTFNNSPQTVINNGTQNFNYENKKFDPNKKIMHTNLQILSSTFTGREEYIKKIDDLLTKQDVIVLSG
ncbi:MAG: hypothetical protein ABF289_14725, partial [Clostridiales bacterium]